jgi:hypothetical protein
MALAYDLFKFDIARQLVSNLPALKKIEYAPLWVDEADATPASIDRNFAGDRNDLLKEYLAAAAQAGPDRRPAMLAEYFAKEGVNFDLFTPDANFFADKRDPYFAELAPTRLNGALFLLDPPAGVRIQGFDKRALNLPDLKKIYNRMPDESLLAVFHRKPSGRSWQNEIIEKNQFLMTFARYVAYVCDSDFCLILFTRSNNIAEAARRTLEEYRNRYSRVETEYV